MTQEDIIRMAREAGMEFVTTNSYSTRNKDVTHLYQNMYGIEKMEHFAALVAAHEAKEHLKMLDNLREETKAHCLQAMAEAYEMGKQDEREACAKVCEESSYSDEGDYWKEQCAAAIRARSSKH